MPDIASFVVFIALLVLLARPLGGYMHRVFAGERTFADPVLKPVERAVYRAAAVDPEHEMRWTTYALALLVFNLVGVGAVYALLRVQGMLPLNPQHAPGMSPHLAFNTAVSFVSNTNWQAYAGESAVSDLSQMAGLAWQNFVSASAGMAVAVALVRGLTRTGAKGVGNFWVDLTRSWLYVLLPLSIIGALFLVSQGVVQDLGGPVVAQTLEGARQVIPLGPVASQEIIKELGTNGGGFFNANSAHPFENPTPLSNLVETLAILAIPASLTYMFGRFAGDQRQGWVLFSAMLVLFVVGTGVIYASEYRGNPALARAGVERSAGGNEGGNMEGKEVRFGIGATSLFENATTAASCGAVTASHDSLMPLAGGMAMLNIGFGEVVFGGVGAGLYGILVFAVLAVFIAGLMVGRTPEYLGKKIGPKEMKMAMLAVLVLEGGILVGAAIAASTPVGLAARLNAGPHGLSEILYAFHSAVGNNGSAFGGLDAGNAFYDTLLGIGMLVGRYLFIVPVLAIAGSMAAKQTVPPSAGTFPTDGGLFAGLLVGIIVIVGALTFFPAYALGPVLDQLLLVAGRLM